MTAGVVVLSPPASAAEPCRAGWLCLYDDPDFDDMAFTTQRRGTCWDLQSYGIGSVGSYRNNLSVYVDFFDVSQDDNVWSIRPGGSSSDASSFHDERYVCTR
ncbi:peptidase inhibitor family I36 protein [Streptomyces avermitilis]|uniref:peptidase inhibitor family I36 protein n=1 Tax=Streptomyces avermitilis TaxID=33903 RepID=UPI0033D7EAFF